MKIIDQYCQWINPPPTDALQIIERAGRTCYKSEDKITDDSAAKFVQMIQNSGHASVIEHISASMLFVTDRGVTHEIVRHRIASYSQESTRYCNYGKEKFGREITFIRPVWMSEDILEQCGRTITEPFKVEYEGGHEMRTPLTLDELWMNACLASEQFYLTMTDSNRQPNWNAQQARSVLPNSLKTEIVMTANLREWIHFFNLRCSTKAHPQMRDLALQALTMFNHYVPVLFGKLAEQYLVSPDSVLAKKA